MTTKKGWMRIKKSVGKSGGECGKRVWCKSN